MDSAYLAAENALLDQRVFVVSGKRYRTLLDLLNHPVEKNIGLRDLFSKPAPWH
jgi:uncharacterized protein (DUF1778 family)